MDWVQILVAIALVLFGRRLFWFFIACIGFAAGYGLAGEIFTGAEPDVLLIAGLILGFFGMLVAFFLQKFAVSLGGFLAGCYISLVIMEIIGVPIEGWALLALVIGGLIGIFVLNALFDPALVLLSSIAGAALLVQATMPNPPVDVIVFLIVALLGVVFQLKLLRGAPKPARA